MKEKIIKFVIVVCKIINLIININNRQIMKFNNKKI